MLFQHQTHMVAHSMSKNQRVALSNTSIYYLALDGIKSQTELLGLKMKTRISTWDPTASTGSQLPDANYAMNHVWE